jgi:hypothetical protein
MYSQPHHFGRSTGLNWAFTALFSFHNPVASILQQFPETALIPLQQLPETALIPCYKNHF